MFQKLNHPFHPYCAQLKQPRAESGYEAQRCLTPWSLKREIRIYRKCSFHQQEGSSCFSHGGFLSPTAAYLKNQPSLRGYFEGQKLHGPEMGGAYGPYGNIICDHDTETSTPRWIFGSETGGKHGL